MWKLSMVSFHNLFFLRMSMDRHQQINPRYHRYYACYEERQATSYSTSSEWRQQVHTLWPVKFCPSAGANLFSLTCKLLQGNEISSDKTNNIIINTPNDNIVLDHQIKAHDGWVAGVDFL